MHSDMDQLACLNHLLDQDSITEKNMDEIIVISGGLGTDVDKSNLYKKIIEKGLIADQWIILVNNISTIGSDMDKSNLLITIAQKMPKTENLKTAYLKTAKTINNDFDYGKALRAIE